MTMPKLLTLIMAISVAIATAIETGGSQSAASYVPPDGFVPDATTARRIAEAIWIPIYGEKHIRQQKPFKAVLRGDVWTVSGKDLPPGTVGGVAEADISKRDGRILRVVHTQ